MRQYEAVTETRTVTNQKLVKKTCDLCGKEARAEDDWDSASSFDYDETTVEVKVVRKKGERYPSGGSETEYAVDLCPDCFAKKLIPWLESQGAAVHETDIDW